MGLSGWVILCVAIYLGLAALVGIDEAKRKKELDDKLAALKDFTVTQRLMDTCERSGIAIDEGRHKLCLIGANHGKIPLDVLSYKELLAAEIFEDGNTITRTSRTSQIGGMLIGGLALGGVGAIIGGLSGKKISSNKVQRLDLRLIVNRTNWPCHDINIMNKEVQKHDPKYKAAMEKARQWHGILEVVIHRADQEDRAKEGLTVTSERNALEQTSLADELRKLANLKEEGVLSDDEFAAQKAKLLS